MTAWKTDHLPGTPMRDVPRIAYDHMGEGPLLVFLHGIGGNRTNWRGQLPAFAAHFHAVAWDARGYGASDDYAGPLDFADFSRDLLRLLDHFRAERAHICGLSMGGRIALDFHARFPERVASLVLCDSFAGFDASFTPEKRAEFVRLRTEPLRQGKAPKDMAPAVAMTLMGPSSPPWLFEQLVASMAALHAESYIKTVEATTHYDRVAALGEIAVPVLLVYGAEDRLTPVRIGRDMADRIPDARLVVIERAGHLPNLEKPDEFNRIVLDFLMAQHARA